MKLGDVEIQDLHRVIDAADEKAMADRWAQQIATGEMRRTLLDYDALKAEAEGSMFMDIPIRHMSRDDLLVVIASMAHHHP